MQTLAMLGKIIQDFTTLKYFSYFLQIMGFDIANCLSYMKCQTLFSEKTETINYLPSADFTHPVLKVKVRWLGQSSYIIIKVRQLAHSS